MNVKIPRLKVASYLDFVLLLLLLQRHLVPSHPRESLLHTAKLIVMNYNYAHAARSRREHARKIHDELSASNIAGEDEAAARDELAITFTIAGEGGM